MTVRGKDYSVIQTTLIKSFVVKVTFMAKHRPFIKADKLGRICAIYWQDSNSMITPPEFKETLNMFNGRQLSLYVKDCLNYLNLSLAKQEGDEEASKEIDRIHYMWNHEQDID